MAHMTNPLATPEQLYRRNSFSSLPQDLQDVVFFATQCLTQAAGLLLQLPQSVTARANVLIARYWLVESMMSHEYSDVSAAALYLVSKLGPSPRSPRDLVTVYAYLLSPGSSLFRSEPPRNDPASYYLGEPAYNALRTRMLDLEARILFALGFDTHVSLPHPLAITYLQALDFLCRPKEEISQAVVRYLNTALLTPQMLYLTHQPNALAVAAIYNAARDVGARMPACEWWEVFDVDREELGFLVVGMRSLDGWAAKMREDAPRLREGMVSRAEMEDEMAKRGLFVGNGNGRGGASSSHVDQEAEMARMMDERMAQAETSTRVSS